MCERREDPTSAQREDSPASWWALELDGRMLLQSAGLALLAALSPTALLILAIYLGSERPRFTAALYMTGAVVMSLVTAVVILVVLRNAGVSHPAEHTPRYALRVGLGVVLLAAGLVVARRKERAPGSGHSERGVISRLVAHPAPLSAFLAGVVVFAPGATFVAALQVIATARATLSQTALAVVVVVIINVLLVWMPLVLYLTAPDMTTRHLTTLKGWLRAHGRIVLVGVLVVAGAIMVGNGIYGLVGVR